MNKSNFSYANLSNLSLIENLYNDYLKNSESVDLSWRSFFEGMDFASTVLKKTAGGQDLRVYELIQAYRNYGHLSAQINPLEPPISTEDVPQLNLKRLGFQSDEMDKIFPTFGFLPENTAPLKSIIDKLKHVYCGTIGIEYMGFEDLERETWIQKLFEEGRPVFNADKKLKVLEYLMKAELFEAYLHMKYVGQTRFSLEGAETLVPILIHIVEEGAKIDLKEVVMGMAHRGRLNVLFNILSKPLKDIFAEFEGYYSPGQIESTGDVKYHHGLNSKFKTESGQEVLLSLTPNPSHLESVNPVVEGQVRALQEKKADKDQAKEILPLIIHGDAAMTAQGVVYETIQLSDLNGYSTCGTIHIAINNQIGFTTLAKDARSTRYCTDIAKTFGSPVFHVNAEDTEMCLFAAQMAIEIRQKFKCDVFIDLNCYRKYGHNEGDEPSFTQPVEYQIIRNKKLIRELYRDQLLKEGILDPQKDEALQQNFQQELKSAFENAKNLLKESPQINSSPSTSASKDLFSPFKTSVALNTLIQITEKFCKIPEGFKLNPKVQKLFQDRLKMVQEDPNACKVDWGMGEYLAYGSLLWEGVHVRLTGEDCRRGTFSHRHAAWMDQASGERYFPLSHLKESQGLFDVFNSPLSEFACMGFEFGYSATYLESLVVWEAQYGDFVNGAQIIIDQYITSAEQKWNFPNAITLMLPHAYEGQGPEHSSARMERFLQQGGHDNIQVVNCTTPSQLFHVLRRQGLRPIKKPLILFTPKGLLRHPLCVSSMNDLSNGAFQEILDDPSGPQNPKVLFMCSGKIYYDLIAERDKRQIKNMALVRIEQLYPLDLNKLKTIFQKYQGFQQCVWIQEEHRNMGAWDYIHPYINELLEGKMQVRYIGRDRSAATAVGSSALHKKEYQQMMDEAFTGL